MRSGLPPLPGSSGSELSYHHSLSKPLSFNLISMQPDALNRETYTSSKISHRELYKTGYELDIARQNHVESACQNTPFKGITAITQLEHVEEKNNPG